MKIKLDTPGRIVDKGYVSATLDALREALETGHRRVVVVSGKTFKRGKLIGKLAGTVAHNLLKLKDKVNILYATDALWEGSFGRIGANKFIAGVRKYTGAEGAHVTLLPFCESHKALGRTFDFIALDITNNLYPNDLGILVETARGGAVIFMLMPEFPTWVRKTLRYHEDLLVPPYTPGDIKHRFERRFVRKLYEHEGIYIFSLEGTEEERLPKPGGRYAELWERRPPSISDADVGINPKIVKMSATDDQIRVLFLIGEIAKVSGEKQVLVITADRGRGKSAAVGLGVVGVAEVTGIRPMRVVVTAPAITAVQVFFEFLLKALDALGYTARVEREGDLVKEVVSQLIIARYRQPAEAFEEPADVAVVDEVAGVYVPFLFRILSSFDRVIFSTTLHGYEGAGRSFNIKFLRTVRQTKGVRLLEVDMDEPVRYASGDPVERWLFDVLALDSEPDKLSGKDKEDISRGRINFVAPNVDSWFDTPEGEREMKSFVGIYVFAHYRNQPSDIAVLADAPHYELRLVKTDGGKVVNAVEIAVEGGFPESLAKDVAMVPELPLPGHVIPSLVARYYEDIEFPQVKGARIVRIATHPDVMNMGLGSFVLARIEEEMKNRGDIHWYGASFGANRELLRFWLKNGFIPIHVSPIRTQETGEYTVTVVKPLRGEMREKISRYNSILGERFLKLLPKVFRDMDPDVAIMLLRATNLGRRTVTLGEDEVLRYRQFKRRLIPWEYVADVVFKVSAAYFSDPNPPEKLESWEEKLLMMNGLQFRDLQDMANELKMERGKVIVEGYRIFHKIIPMYVTSNVDL